MYKLQNKSKITRTKGTPSVIKQIHYNCLIGVKKQDYVDPLAIKNINDCNTRTPQGEGQR